MSRVEVVSIGGKAPVVTRTTSGRTIYSAQGITPTTDKSGKITGLSRTTSRNSIFSTIEGKSGVRELSPFEASAAQDNISLPSGQSGYASVNVAQIKENIAAQRIVEARTSIPDFSYRQEQVPAYAQRNPTPVPASVYGVGQPTTMLQRLKGRVSAVMNERLRLPAFGERIRSTARENVQYYGPTATEAFFAAPIAKTGRFVYRTAAKAPVLVETALRVTKAGKAVYATKVGTIGLTTLRAVVEGTAVGATVKGVSEAFSRSDVRSLMKTSEFKEAQKVAIERRNQELKGWRRFADQAIIGVGGKTNLYGKYLSEELEKRGVSGQSGAAKLAASSSLGSLQFGETAAFVYQSSLVEGYGRKGISKGLAGIRAKVTKEGLTPALKKAAGFTLKTGGFIEGFSQSVTSDILRGQKVNYGVALGSGGVGAVSAYTIGIPIIRQSIKPSARGFLISAASEVIDPLERQGDMFRDVGVGGVKRFDEPSSKIIRTVTPSGTKSYSLTPVSKGKPSGRTPSVSANAQTISRSTVSSKTTSYSVGVKTPAKVNVPSRVATTLTTPTQTPVSILTPSQTVTTQTTTNVPTYTRTTVNTPVSTRVTLPTRVTVATPTIYPRIGTPLVPLKRGGGFGRSRAAGSFMSRAKYTPSVTAVALGITASSAPSTKSGLNVRPIITRGKTMKRKKLKETSQSSSGKKEKRFRSSLGVDLGF